MFAAVLTEVKLVSLIDSIQIDSIQIDSIQIDSPSLQHVAIFGKVETGGGPSEMDGNL